ncbi:MAG: hypothetical protein WBF33_14390 [Candidatus Nitrosopolaris sp.]
MKALRYTAYTDDPKTKRQRQRKEEICKECGHDHGFRPSFKDVKTSIDVIPLLIQRLREAEQKETS